MNFGMLRKKANHDRNLLWKLYFIIGSIIILLAFIIYTNRLVFQAKKEAQVVPNLFAHFVSLSTEENFDGLLLQYILEDIIAQIDYPIIVTDSTKTPLYWKNIGIDEKTSFSDLNAEDNVELTETLSKMMKNNWVIPLKVKSEDSRILGYTYYSESFSMKQLRIMPYLEMLVILIFVMFGFYGFIFMKKQERDQLWVGLAKETAHQFGTPISSLLGWIDVLKMKVTSGNKLDDVEGMLDYMQNDVLQLKKVASRFGKVGSNIKLKPTDLHDIINETIAYFELRIPNMSKQIRFHFISKIKGHKINIDVDLLKWALENLIKNSIDAMQAKGGNIIITTFSSKKQTTILIKDEGKGIPKSMYSKIFSPGVTSKKRGWGLGLSLAKRIVEDYHKGKIRVLESTIDEGTTFEIMLPED